MRADNVIALAVNATHDVQLPDGRTIAVTLVDAHHCPGGCARLWHALQQGECASLPGAVMVMLEGAGFEPMLYTGDFRYEPHEPVWSSDVVHRKLFEVRLDRLLERVYRSDRAAGQSSIRLSHTFANEHG